MKRYLMIITVMIICPNIFAYNKIIHPQTDYPDFYIGSYTKGWKIPLTITSDIFAGLKIEIEFSTPPTALNQSIVILGSYKSGIDYGITLAENNSQIRVARQVKCRGKTGIHNTLSWNKNLLERSSNYILSLEIDETRFRYSIRPSGNESKIEYEYLYDGLASSYVREKLVEDNIMVAVNIKDYFIQNLSISDLVYDVGVKPILPETSIRYGHIINVASSELLRRYGTLSPNDYIIQLFEGYSANELWKITPKRQSDRTINSYDVILQNLYRDRFIGPQNCSTYDGAYITETNLTDCNQWTIESDNSIRPKLWLKNIVSKKYIMPQYPSVSKSYIIQNSDKKDGSLWLYRDLKYEAPLKNGYYSIKNKHSGKYMYVYSNSYIVQHSDNNSDQIVWYLEQQPEGTYHIRNADTREYLSLYGGYFQSGSYISQAKYLSGSPEKWIIKKESEGWYSIKSLASGKALGVRYESTTEDEYIIQDNKTSDSYLWGLNFIDFYAGKPLGGFFRLKNSWSDLYLCVQGNSTAANAYLVTTDNPKDISTIWTIEQIDNGGYALKNVNSQLYASVRYRNSVIGEYITQKTKGDCLIGNQLWRIWESPVPIHNYFYFKSIFDGEYMTVKNNSTVPGEYIVQSPSTGEMPDPDLRMRWLLVPVDPKELE